MCIHMYLSPSYVVLIKYTIARTLNPSLGQTLPLAQPDVFATPHSIKLVLVVVVVVVVVAVYYHYCYYYHY